MPKIERGSISIHVMRLFILISFFGLVAQSCAKEIKLAASPDSRYEVVIANEPGDDAPFARIRDKKTGKTFATDAHGYDHHSEIEATWRQDSGVVALNFSAGKTTHETLLYSVGNGRIAKIQLPDFILNILGRQGAITAKFKNSTVSFVKFLPDHECLLFAHVEPDASEQANGKTRADDPFRPTEITDYDVTLRLNYPSQTDLVAVEPSKEL